MAKIIKPYTLCQVVIHIKQELSIRLQSPVDLKIQRAKADFHFEEANLDSDSDFIATSGFLPDYPEIKIRTVALYPSQNRLSIDTIGGTTNQSIHAIQSIIDILYGLDKNDLSRGIHYLEYKTVTRAELSTNLDGLFSKEMNALFKSWRDFGSESIVSPLPDQMPDTTHGMVSISKEYFDRLYHGQDRIFVLPGQISFTVLVPTNYHRMTTYNISISTRSFEDFIDRNFFFTSELPYGDHVELINMIEKMG